MSAPSSSTSSADTSGTVTQHLTHTTTQSQQQTAFHIESTDIIRLILQYLRETHLESSLRTLSLESNVTLNSVDSLDTFLAAIVHGQWDNVLKITSTLSLSSETTLQLYEQIYVELLLDKEEKELAWYFFKHTPIFQIYLKEEHKAKYNKLESYYHTIVKNPHALDLNTIYPEGTTKETQRKNIAEAIKAEVFVVPPGRLLSLLQQSLKWQQLQGMLPTTSTLAANHSVHLLDKHTIKYDLFRDCLPPEVTEEEIPTSKHVKTIKFGKRSHCEVSKFSYDGQYLITGSIDGYIEVWDPHTGKLHENLSYQDTDIMQHDASIVSLAISLSSELLATGDAQGNVKIWRIATGSCVKKFMGIHAEGVTALEFTRDGTKLLSASFDNTIKLLGLKSGKALKEFRGHNSFVNAAIFSDNSEFVLSASSDATIKVWDVKTAECLRTIRLPNVANTPINNNNNASNSNSSSAANTSTGDSTSAILSVQVLPSHMDRYIVVSSCGVIRLINIQGEIIQSYKSISSLTNNQLGGTVIEGLDDEKNNSSSTTSAAAVPKPPSSKDKRAASLPSQSASSISDFVAAIGSPKGQLLYAITEECILHVFHVENGTLLAAVKVHRHDILGLAHHPHRNLLASFAQDGTVKLWKPA